MTKFITKASLIPFLITSVLYLTVIPASSETETRSIESRFTVENSNHSSNHKTKSVLSNFNKNGPTSVDDESLLEVDQVQVDVSINDDALRQGENKATNFRMHTEEQTNLVEKFLYSINEFEGNYSLSDLENLVINYKLHALVYNDLFIHNYESYKDLISAGGPQVNQESCLNGLRELIERLEQFEYEKHASKDLNLHMLLDTFGRPTSGVTIGHINWVGLQKDCQKMKIKTKTQQQHETRFCYALLKHQRPLQANIANELSALKLGVCLPKTCDSLNYKDKFELVERLVEFNMRQVDLGERKLSYLYCLPDEESSLRVWWKSPKTLVTVIILSFWLAGLVYSTIKFHIITSEHQEKLQATGEHSMGATSDPYNSHSFSYKIHRSLSIVNNIKSLFRTEKVKKEKKKEESVIDEKESKQEDSLVDLGVIDGIKVISMAYIITGHVLLSFTTIQQNPFHLNEVNLGQIVFFSSNMMPAFAVNGFFTITGILTTFFLFKSSHFSSLISDGRKWITVILYRYLRIMPMYVIVFAYTKYLAKFMGSGPLWDYGTSSFSPRRTCEEESWWWTLLFGANFKPVLKQCIPSAWYLANDFQFFLVTPFFLNALYKRPKFGQRFISLCIIVGMISGFFSIVLSEGNDLNPVMKFMPHGFKTYVTFLSDSYTRPHNRIPAYLCGLLLGFILYNYEKNKLRYLEQKRSLGKEKEAEGLQEPNWPNSLKRHGTLISFLGLSSGILLPAVGIPLNANRFYGKILIGLTMTAYHVIFSLSVGLYILMASTGYGNSVVNNILTASIWKPLSKLSLCVVLTNLEVTNYLMQTSAQFFHMDFKSHTALNLISILFSYLTGTIICILFELPLKSTLNNVINFAASRMTVKQKKMK